MEVTVVTLHAKLLVACPEQLGYRTLIFEDLEYKDSDLKYLTCVMFPNWDQGVLNEGDVGFLQVKFISAGIDKWFDGKDFVPYKYSNIQFIGFVKEKPKMEVELILD